MTRGNACRAPGTGLEGAALNIYDLAVDSGGGRRGAPRATP
jgi:hypothetical protein